MYCYSRGSEFIRLPGPYRTLPYRIRLEFLSRSRSLCARRTVVLPKILRFSAKKAISANRTVFSRVGDCDPIADCDPNFSIIRFGSRSKTDCDRGSDRESDRNNLQP
jgi:hypothetical protein